MRGHNTILEDIACDTSEVMDGTQTQQTSEECG